ncbi:thioredoxin M3, chloroplastic [Impatiens glandulifera]|uniref:thioredoxin M3, chloroplastic n=1 Tax=Impatiens glandulifera TaxID=253017 RepID=UPI001FB19B65|nr:thioredoxin M3, chloroplastic [Impatiens glandulifera]
MSSSSCSSSCLWLPENPRNLSFFSKRLQFQIPKPNLKSQISPSRLTIFSLRDSKADSVVNTKTWKKLVLNNKRPVLVEFYTNWCGPCRMVHRIIDEIGLDYGGRLQCLSLNADDELKVIEDYDVKAVPIVLLFKDGVKCDSLIGTLPKEFYVSAIDKLFFSS